MEARQVLAERYELVEELGRGGMSAVWRAHDVVLDRDVAVKVLAGARAGDPAQRRAIRAEAQIAAQITHPHVAGVYDFGESVSESGEVVPFVVMELLRGQSLEARLAAGPLAAGTAVRICAEVAGGLAAAHARDLVHRDVKPGNVMLVGGRAKVFDFGIAAAVGTLDDPGPEAPIFGTPGYLAPERLLGAPVNAASDVYALGLLLYRLVTGELPWPARTAAQMMMAHVYSEPVALPQPPGIPDSVVELYLRCVAKDPRHRPSAREACLVLAAAAGIRAPLGEDGEESGPIAIVRPLPATSVASRRLRIALVLAAAAIIVAGAAAAASQLGGGSADPPGQAGPGGTSITGVGAGGGTPSTGGSDPRSTAGPGGTGLPNPIPGGTNGPIGGPGPGAGPGAGPDGTVEPTPPPGTTTPPGPEPTVTATASEGKTFSSSGGWVTAVCYDTRAYLEQWGAAAGYKVTSVDAGPAVRARIMFQTRSQQVLMIISCVNGDPTVSTQIQPLTGR